MNKEVLGLMKGVLEDLSKLIKQSEFAPESDTATTTFDTTTVVPHTANSQKKRPNVGAHGQNPSGQAKGLPGTEPENQQRQDIPYLRGPD